MEHDTISVANYSRWRIGVCGSSHSLAIPAAEMCEALGERLGAYPTALIIHSGLKRRLGATQETNAADWHFVEGAKRTVKEPMRQRVETFIADSPEASPWTAVLGFDNATSSFDANAEVFIEGSVQQVHARTREVRRFRFVSSLDAMIALGGGYGTRQQLTLAAAIEIPILPIPCFKGSAGQFWSEHRVDLMSRLKIDDGMAREWENPPISQEQVAQFADDMVCRLMHCLPRRAFIIMPFAPEFDTLFDLVIEPAVTGRGDEIYRLDRMHRPGGVIDQIEGGIRSADYCIVVLDGMRPNVLYEMGFAHALGKPLVLMMQHEEVGKDYNIPFDISTFQRIGYDRPDRATLATLKTALKSFT